MSDSQEFKPYEILPIKTIEQLVASHLVAEILVEIRNEIKNKEAEELEFDIPQLKVKNSIVISERAQELYKKAFSIMKFKPSYVFIMKMGIEDMYNYKFSDDASITTMGSADTIHLQKMFSTRFTDLSKVSLEEHTLNVFENALDMAENSGRASSMSIAILAALFHDFGKSSKIRKAVLGEGMQRGVKAHAEVSASYLQDLLLPRVYNIIEDSYSLTESTDRLVDIVKFHHPANKDQREDLEISFVIGADHEARKNEMINLRRK